MELVWGGPNLENTSPLHVAAWAGLTDYTKHLLKNGIDCNHPDAQQRTALSWAAAKGHTEIVALLLQHGSNPDQDDRTGQKPLHYAARTNHHAVVKLLLGAGVSPLTIKTRENPGRHCGNSPSTKGQTPLLYACQGGNVETTYLLIHRMHLIHPSFSLLRDNIWMLCVLY
ncbi:HECT-type E3 ubiquitin transferase HACE1 [Hyphodiscus hymeniophilus]|uniref:HECT-type E3 ubiquitin transferase HACE1 n=1 Tax=Hyphodiscus hymeniophilus TaxID=353542 RepID=A0A9P7AVK5_9HELO|nr:HECT-type E3 ubiquitin transferase HACE1 [Hyphodiscus hymeniophilus]